MKPKDPDAARSFCRTLMAGAESPSQDPERRREAGIHQLAVAAIAMAHRRAGLCSACAGARLADGLHARPCEACPSSGAARRLASALPAAARS